MVTFHEDLRPYEYEGRIYPNILSIGWLDNNHSYPMGQVPNLLAEKLLLLTCGCIEGIDLISMKVRSFERCPFTNEKIEYRIPNSKKTRLVGMSELCIPNKDNNILYCFPDMLYHYITEHSYLPPMEFLNSLDYFNLNKSYKVGESMATIMKII